MSYISTLTTASGSTPNKISSHHHHQPKLRSQEQQLLSKTTTITTASSLLGEQPPQTPTAQGAAQISSPRYVNRRIACGVVHGGGGGGGAAGRASVVAGFDERSQESMQSQLRQLPTADQAITVSTKIPFVDADRSVATNQLGRTATTGIPAPPPNCSPRQRATGLVPNNESPMRSNQSYVVSCQKTITSLSSQERMQAQAHPQTPIHIQAAPRLSKALPRLISQQQQLQNSISSQQDSHEKVPTVGYLFGNNDHGHSIPRRLVGESDAYCYSPHPQQYHTPTANEGIVSNKNMNLNLRNLSKQTDLDKLERHQFSVDGDQPGQEQPFKQQQQQPATSYLKSCQQNNLPSTPPSQRRQVIREEASEQTNQQSSATRTTHYLPRYGVSKIPHQVHGNEMPNDGSKYNRYYQSRSSSKKESCDDRTSNNNIIDSKYLTFSKDQATSHFKSLKEELSTTTQQAQILNEETNRTEIKVREFEESNLFKEQQHHHYYQGRLTDYPETSPLSEPKPLDRISILKHSQQQQHSFEGANDDGDHQQKSNHLQQQQQSRDNISHQVETSPSNDRRLPQPDPSNGATNNSSRQQPICEAFIMTGQSMLKLSCNESENSNNKSKVNTNSLSSSSNIVDSGNTTTTTNNNNSASVCNNNSADNIEHAHRESSSREASVEARQQQLSRSYPSQRGKSLSLNKLNENTTSQSIRDHLLGPTGGRFCDKEIEQRPQQQQQQQQPLPHEPEQPLRGGQHERPAPTASTATNSTAMGGEQKTRLILRESNSIKLDDPTSQLIDKTMDDDELQMDQQEVGGDERENSSFAQQRESSGHERESARRLAKRLYNLSGFKRSDVCHHLSKNNPFSQMVIEEYLNLFDFRTMKLDASLRKFLSKLQLTGETQERERMLSQFSKRYYDCNKEKFPNADTVQTLVCALILLNTDLHGGHIDRKRKNKRTKLSLGAFIDGLNSSLASLPAALSTTTSETNNSSHTTHEQLLPNNNTIPAAYTFPRHLLVDLYESIKKRPLKYVEEKCDMTSFEAELDKIYSQHQLANGGSRSNTLPTRRFAPGSNAPSSTMSSSSRRQIKYGLDKLNGANYFDDPETAIEFKSGLCNRKRINEAQGRPTSKGRRGWRRAYFILRDLRLVMRYDQVKEFSCSSNKENDGHTQDADKQQSKGVKSPQKQQSSPKSQAKLLAQDMKNMIRVHHSFAKRSTSYTKRDHVFHLVLSDQSEYLIQADTEQEMLYWIDTINFASACLSSPALPSAISNSKRFQQHYQLRPILPANYTKLSYWEQLIDHEERLQRLKVELEDHLNDAPKTRNANKRFKTEFIDKIAYLKQEIQRYSVYVDLMRKKSNSPEAIILSKHPQIASLTPSEEMIKSLPSLASSKPADDKLIEAER